MPLTVGFSAGSHRHYFGVWATAVCLLPLVITDYGRIKLMKRTRLLQWFFAIGGAFALQNSALHWSSDHRVHHKFVDQNDKDPYSAQRGFWFSHIGWMLREYQKQRMTITAMSVICRTTLL